MDRRNAMSGESRIIDGPLRIGDWRVLPELNRLEQGPERCQVEPRLMRLLVLLAERRGSVVPKDDIVARVWDGRPVSDETLAKAISKLRKALGDNPDAPRYVETVRKSGYRLVAAVETAVDTVDAVDAGGRAPASRWQVVAALAVLVAIVGVALLVYFNTRPSPPPGGAGVLRAVPLTSRPGRERDPHLSGNGALLVYSAAADDGSSQVFLHGIGRGAGDRQVTQRDDNRAPVFFPGDDRVAYLRRSGARCTVMMTTLLDGAERVLGDCGGNGYSDTAMSPDGRYVAFNARGDDGESRAIYVLDVDTGTRRAVTSPPPGIWGDYDPRFTADGRAIVFARSVSESLQDLYLVYPADGIERQLTNEGRNIMGIALRNGRIVYGSNRGGRYSLWALGLDGDGLEPVPVSSAGILNPSVSADGAAMVVEAIDRSVALRRVDTAGDTSSAPVLEFNADILHPDVSAANARIAFSTNRSGFYEIWDADESGADLRQLTRFASGFTAHPRYSPDGSRIAFDARPGPTARVFTMYADGSQAVALTDGTQNAYAPTWSADGRALYYAMEGGGTLQIWRADVATGAAVQVTTDGGFFAREGQDGFLYHVRPNADGLWRMRPGEPAAPERMLAAPAFADWGNWDVRDGRIVYFDRAEQALRSYALDSGAITTLANVDARVPPADPTLAVAGDGMLLGDMTRYDSDIELIRFDESP